MGHTSDCAVNDGPAFLPGPCDCGLELGVDDAKLFRPLCIIGARGSHWEVRQRNVEALIETEELPVRDGGLIRLTIHLIDTHGWPTGPCSSNGVDLRDSLATMVGQREANAPSQGLKCERSVIGRAHQVFRAVWFAWLDRLQGLLRPTSKCT